MGGDGVTTTDEAQRDADLRYDPFDYRLHADPNPVYAWLRVHAPVYRNEERDFWALSRYHDVDAALHDWQRFSSCNGISLESELWGPHAVNTGFFLAMDPPLHGQYRRLVSTPFAPRQVAAMEPRIRQLARERLEPLRDQRRFDFAADYALALPNDVLCDMLGVPSVDWDQIRADSDQLSRRADGSDRRGTSAATAALRLADYFHGLVKDLRRRPGDNLTSDLLHGGELTDAQVVAFLFLAITGGNDSAGKTIGNAWFHGWRHPEAQRAGLNGRAADWSDETLRYDSASQMVARTLTEDTVLHGTHLPAGARIAILHGSANRDERAFPEPDRYDLDRDTSRLMSFGRGRHFCLGAALARLEMAIALEEIANLVSGYEIDLAGARRVHSPHLRGFAVLPCEVTYRPRPTG
jgi:YD repeat-containing protein